MGRDIKAAAAGIVVGAFLLLFIHGLVTTHPDLSVVFLALGAIAIGVLSIMVAQLSV